MQPEPSPLSNNAERGRVTRSPIEIDVSRIDRVVFSLKPGPLRESLSDLFSLAALVRCIACAKDHRPHFLLVHANHVSNALHGSMDLGQLVGLDPSGHVQEKSATSPAPRHTLFLDSKAMYERDFSRLQDAFHSAGSSFESYPQLVANAVKLGHFPDRNQSVSELLRYTLSLSADPIVRSLLRLARLSEAGDSSDPAVSSAERALSTLQAENNFLRLIRGKLKQPMIPAITDMIVHWSKGVDIPEICAELAQQYDDSREIAHTVWAGAEQLQPGVFKLAGFPAEEQDDLVRQILREIIENDARARYVLELYPDRAPTAILYNEAITFKQRLSAGEAAENILEDVQDLLRKRNDTGNLAQLALQEMREREPSEMLEGILAHAEYLPDPDGQYLVVKQPREDELYPSMVRVGIPIIGHATMWMVNPSTLDARPFSIVVKAQELPALLRLME